MISDKAIAENIKRLISNREVDDDFITFENRVFDGVRYITFTGMDNQTFLDSYTLLQKVADITNTDGRKETWRNPHFNVEWEAIKPYLMDAIDDDEKTPIVLSGHGIAGAIAVIAGYHLTMHHKNLLCVVTFGAPPALNSKKLMGGFINPLQQITTQYVLPSDPMPKLFKFTKYQSAKRTVLDYISKDSEISNYFDALKWGEL